MYKLDTESNKDLFCGFFAAIKRVGADKLLEWLSREGFFTAPASTRFHLSVKGGLCQHSLNVFNRLSDLCIQDQLGGVYSAETLAICGLLHDVCKVNFYGVEMRNKKVYHKDGSKTDLNGRFDWRTEPVYVVDDRYPYGHGEKSVDIIRNFIDLTEEERIAIRWHMGGFDDSVKGGSYALSAAYKAYPLAAKLHAADVLATYIDDPLWEEAE